MKIFYLSPFRVAFLFVLISVLTIKASGQGMPEELTNGTLRDQMNYLEERTRIYDNFRAIREDIFQKIKANALDSLAQTKNRIKSLNTQTSLLNNTIDSLKRSLTMSQSNVEEITRERNSMQVMGMNVDKTIYNSLLWSVIAILLILLVLGVIIFKRNLIIIREAKKDLKDLHLEFEAYRKTSREAREKMTMDHFLEMKRLKGA
jgi:flagellar biosynthesis/type III secretory pathway M-ring protein FliF/YscJ